MEEKKFISNFMEESAKFEFTDELFVCDTCGCVSPCVLCVACICDHATSVSRSESNEKSVRR